VVELPLFPLPLVLFPGAILPLQIFELRYRMMMHTLLQTDLRFGVIYSDSVSGTADVGCVGEVVKHERLVDDRFFLICKGQERFRVTNLVRTKPYLVAEVTWLEDRPSGDGEEDLEALASEVEGHMKDVIRLSNRLGGKPEKEEPLSDAVFVLRREHIRGRAERAAGAAGAGGHGGEAEEGEGDLAEHAQLLDGRLGR